MGVALVIVVLLEAKKHNIQPTQKKATAKERWDAFKDAFWGFLMPVIILGGIYGSVFTPTEAAAVSVVYGLFVGIFIYKEIKLKDLWDLMVDSAKTTGGIMLMCMFILLALYTFYKRYSGKGQPKDRFLLPFYIFMAIFSKGPVGFIVPLITMLVFLLVKRDVRSFCRYFGWREWGILSGFCAIWFLGIYLEGGSTYLNNLLFHQTINRAIDSFDHKKAFWYYGVTFWYSVAPWSILYITTIVIAIKKKLLTTDKEKLFLSAIVSTFVILSMFSGKLDIYMLPLFPFFTYLTILLLPKIKEKWIAFSVHIPVAALTIAPIAAFFIRNKFNVPDSPFIYVAIITLFIFSVTACYLLYRKQIFRAINCTALGILATLFTGAFALPQINPYIGFTAMATEANHIREEENIHHYYYYKFRGGENMDVYLHEEATKISTEDSLFNIYRKGDCMIFVKEKNVMRSPALSNWIQQTHHEKIGNFYLIHPTLNTSSLYNQP